MFFEDEPKGNIRIEYGDMQTFLYSIANEKSAHIIKMKQEAETLTTVRANISWYNIHLDDNGSLIQLVL